MTDRQHDENLMIVYAVEGDAQRHKMRESEVLELFCHARNSGWAAATLAEQNFNRLQYKYHSFNDQYL
jgi:hypothetical protein